MDTNMTVGIRDLVLSGSFVAGAEMSRLRVEQGKPSAGYGWLPARPTAHPTHITTVEFPGIAPIGTDVSVLDRLRTSAPEP